MINVLCVSNALLKLQQCNNSSMGDRITIMEAQLFRLASMWLNVSEWVDVTQFISFLPYLSEYGPLIASVNGVQERLDEYNYFSSSS